MAFAIIVSLYVTIGLLAAAGSVLLSQRLVPTRFESLLFGLFLVAIAGFYLSFTAYFGAAAAWPLEARAVALFALLGVVGIRLPTVLAAGYLLHGGWDFLHELNAHAGVNVFGSAQGTPIPLAYGAFCATYDLCMAAYFMTRRPQWRAAWVAARA